MNLYCITHKKVDYIEKLNLIPSGVGNYNYPDKYENEKVGENISEKIFLWRIDFSLLVLKIR